jgi:hypothetical protein
MMRREPTAGCLASALAARRKMAGASLRSWRRSHQVLLQERVRPAELVVAGGEEDLRARQGDSASRGSMPSDAQSVLSTFAADVVAQGGGGVGAQAELGGDGADALVPQLGGRDGAPLEGVARGRGTCRRRA